MKIVILDGYTENPGDLSWSELEKLGTVKVYDRTNERDICTRIDDAEIVLTNKTPITKTVMEKCSNIKLIAVLATGYNIVDVVAAKERGIFVSNVPTYGTTAVAQYVFALLLEICHHVGEHSACVHRGDWENSTDWCFWNHPLIELAGKTMGIIGYGRIGKTTANIAKAFGMNVLAYDNMEQAPEIVALEELLEKSDVISLHCPLFPDTRGMINKNTIAKMKDGVIIINTSRGPLIEEDDLKEALDSGKVAYAAVDVVSTEPIRGDNPLLSCKNCFITPHIAWAPKESRQRLMDIVVDNVKQYMNGVPVNVVNM